jgi:hypothetical protein
MGFSAKQLTALKRNLNGRQIRTRKAHGRELSYIEGWFAISEANRIFGFDGWSRETLDSKCVLAREIRGAFTAVYTAKVRITVQADGLTIIREGHGSGEGHGVSPGEVHDIGLKAAENYKKSARHLRQAIWSCALPAEPRPGSRIGPKNVDNPTYSLRSENRSLSSRDGHASADANNSPAGGTDR